MGTLAGLDLMEGKSRSEWYKELSRTTSDPLGHTLTPSTALTTSLAQISISSLPVQPDSALPWAQCHVQPTLSSMLLAPLYVQPKIQGNLRLMGLFLESRA